MTPDLPPNPRAELEAKVTALLLGELSTDEAAHLRQLIAKDDELCQLQERLSRTLGFLRETAATPVGETPAQPAPLKLSLARREKLLAHFKTIRPTEFAQPPRRRISWLIPLAAAASIVLLAALFLPMFESKFAIQNSMSVDNLAVPSESAPAPATPPATLGGAGGTSVQSSATAADSKVIRQRLQERRMAENREQVAAAQNQQIFLPQSGEQQFTQENKQFNASTATLNNDGSINNSFNAGLGVQNGPSSDNNRNGLYDNNGVADMPVTANAPASTLSAWQGNPAVTTPPAALAAPAPEAGDISGTVAASSAIDQLQYNDSNFKRGYGNSDPGKDAAQLGDQRDKFVQGALAWPSSPPVTPPPAAPAKAGIVSAGNAGGVAIGGGFKLDNDTHNAVVTINGQNSWVDTNGSIQPPVVFSQPSFALTEGAANGSIVVSRNITNSGDLVVNYSSSSAAAPLVAANGNAPSREAESASDRKQAGEFYQLRELPAPTASPAPAHAGERMVKKEIQPAPIIPLTPIVPIIPRSLTAPKETLASGALTDADKKTGKWELALDDSSKTSSPPAALAVKQNEDLALLRPPLPPPVPQPEVLTSVNAFTTFSLNVSDVAFKLAQASLQNGQMPEAASMRSEEFINAFDYRDPEPAPGAPIGFAWERAGDPFAHNRDFLRFSIKTAAQGRQPGRPLNLVLILDKSGSMERADRVEIIAQALRVLASQLQPQDTFSVVVFARTARLFVDGVSGSQAGDVAKNLRDLTPEGGTNLEEAMRLAYATALRHYLANGENRVVLMTDGAANLGNVEPDALKKEVAANHKQGIALDCFGIGWDGYNDNLLEKLSRAGNGRYGFINTPKEAATEFAGKLAGALRVAAADVKVQVEFNPNRVTSYRQIGYAKDQLKKEDFRNNSVKAAQIGAAEAGNALYTVEINPAGDGPVGTVHVRFRVPGTTDYQEHEWTVPYTGRAVPLEKASPAMRLTATAAAFSEWLAASPYAGDVTPDRLLHYLRGVPQVYGADNRPTKLEWMIRQSKSISGK